MEFVISKLIHRLPRMFEAIKMTSKKRIAIGQSEREKIKLLDGEK